LLDRIQAETNTKNRCSLRRVNQILTMNGALLDMVIYMRLLLDQVD
jgi:hypothetical protein